MNADPTHHLDMEELLAEARGSFLDEAASAHLATCSVCRTETERWKAVSLGVGHLVAAVPAPSAFLFEQALFGSSDTPPSSAPPPGSHRVGLRARRRGLAVASVALLVIGAGSYVMIAALGGGEAVPSRDAGPTKLAAGLTAVTGCPALAFAKGTLEQVTGSDLVVQDPNGQAVTVTVSPSTTIGQEVTASLDAVTDGTHVAVAGTESDGAIAATTVSIGAGEGGAPTPSSNAVKAGVGAVTVVVGTVTDVSTGGFLLVEQDGTDVRVATNSATTVLSLKAASVDQLQVGEFTLAVGAAGQGATLAAGSVVQTTMVRSSPRQSTPDDGVAGRGQSCSSSKIAAGMLSS
jgi:hypothetical protein